MRWVVYTRARAPHALYIYRTPTTTTTTPIYIHLHTTLIGASLVRTRDTPRHARSQGLAVTIGSETTVIFVTFAHQVTAHSRPIHSSFTEFITPNLGCPQAQRWKSAKTKPPSHDLAERHNSRRASPPPTWSPSADSRRRTAFGGGWQDVKPRHGRTCRRRDFRSN